MKQKNTIRRCNICGRELIKKGEIYLEDFVLIEKKWGYFSKKDGETHTFCVCENCYDTFTKKFSILPEVKNTTELL